MFHLYPATPSLGWKVSGRVKEGIRSCWPSLSMTSRRVDPHSILPVLVFSSAQDSDLHQITLWLLGDLSSLENSFQKQTLVPLAPVNDQSCDKTVTCLGWSINGDGTRGKERYLGTDGGIKRQHKTINIFFHSLCWLSGPLKALRSTHPRSSSCLGMLSRRWLSASMVFDISGELFIDFTELHRSTECPWPSMNITRKLSWGLTDKEKFSFCWFWISDHLISGSVFRFWW